MTSCGIVSLATLTCQHCSDCASAACKDQSGPEQVRPRLPSEGIADQSQRYETVPYCGHYRYAQAIAECAPEEYEEYAGELIGEGQLAREETDAQRWELVTAATRGSFLELGDVEGLQRIQEYEEQN